MPFGFPILRKGSELPGFHLVRLSRPKVIVAAVFNASQIEGIPALEPVRDVGWDPVEKAEQLLAVSQAKIQHSQGSGAFYRLSTDTIHMPGSRNNPLHSRIDAQFSAHGGAIDL
jgi:antirestriction protein ArdC